MDTPRVPTNPFTEEHPKRPRLSARSAAIRNVSFFVLVPVTTLAFLALIASFLMPVFWAAVLATVFFPLQRCYVARLRGRRSLATLTRLFTIIGLVVVPVLLAGLAMSRAAIQLHERGTIDVTAPLRFLRRFTPLASDYLGRFGIDIEGIGQRWPIAPDQGTDTAVEDRQPAKTPTNVS